MTIKCKKTGNDVRGVCTVRACPLYGDWEVERVRPEDCTREELIYFIRNHGLFSLKDLESDVKFFRADAALKKQREADETGDRALGKYIELLGQVEGKRLVDVPINTLQEMDVAQKKWKRGCTLSDKYRKEWDAAMAELSERGGEDG